MDGDVYGLEMEPMPEGWTPLEAIIVIKALDEDGDVALLTRATEALRVWDSVGMLTAALDTARERLSSCFRSEDEDDDGEG